MNPRSTFVLGALGLLSAAVVWVPFGCGGTDGTPLFDAGIDAGDDGAAPDGPAFENDAGGADAAGDASEGGACACTGGQICINGQCQCPIYQSFCNGKCIATSVDPVNCGGCGVACALTEACSAGQCSNTCLPPLSKCGQMCVDTKIDNQNCGACGLPCPPNTGCVNGKCKPAVPLGPAPNKCKGGGPPIVIGQNTCLGNVAQSTFNWALCSCGDVSFNGNLLTDAYDSSKGPYKPGGLGGGVGLNGAFGTTSKTWVWGILWSTSQNGLSNGATTDVKQDLFSGGPVTTSSGLLVGKNAWIGGDISASGSLAITGTLTQPNGKTITGNVSYGSLAHVPVSIPPPCECNPQKVLPIKAWVAAQKSTNDNALIGLKPDALASPLGHAIRVDLPCGIYYLTGIDNGADPVAIVAHGQTALFIDGNVTAAPLWFSLDPTATFDVLLSGVLAPWSGADVNLGSPNYPALSRLYEGGSATTSLTGGNIAGELYGASSAFSASSQLTFYGGVFSGPFHNSSETYIHFDLANQKSGGPCPPPPGTCGSCKDCGNQACINGKCGQCGSSSDCCPPLVCQSGTCAISVN